MFITTNKSPLGALKDKKHRGVFNIVAGAILACTAIASSHANAAAVLTFTEINDGKDLQAVLTGTLDVNGAKEVTLPGDLSTFLYQNPAKIQNIETNGVQIVTTGFEAGTTGVYYKVSVPATGDWTDVTNTLNGTYTGTGTPFAFGSGIDPGVYLNVADKDNNAYQLNATITWSDVNFRLLGVEENSEFVYTLLGTNNQPLTGADQTFTLRFVTSQLAPVPLPASVLFLGAGIGGFGLMGRLRRRKLNP